MKRALVTLFLFILGGSYALWIFMATLSNQPENAVQPPPTVAADGGGCAQGAAYPENLWKKLQSHKRQIKFVLKEARDVPYDIEWRDGIVTPDLGDANAKRGGTVKLHNVGPYPANFLAFGSPTPQFFHYTLFERLEIPLVEKHPRTGEPVPGLADKWAVIGRTVWFHLNPAARYTNGRPVRGRDFAMGAYLRSQCSNDAGWQMLLQAAKEVRFYGDEAIAITLREDCPMALFLASAVLHPAEPGFYAEFGSDYTTRYAQRIPPSTGAYVVTHAEKGHKIRMERVKEWWAESISQRVHTCNVDVIEHRFCTDEAQAWELFMHGELDALQTRNMNAWHRYLDSSEAVAEGDIEPHLIQVNYPHPPYGIAVNTERVPELELRHGIMQALDMASAIQVIFRGEARQLTTFNSGYGMFTPNQTPQHQYNPAEARALFAAAGYTEQGPDGILRKPDGTRLSLKLTYTPADKTNTLFTHLAQKAKECGLELIADAQPWQNVADKVTGGTHELLYWSASPSSLMPQPERFLHSTAEGTDAPFRLKSKEMDDALQACYTATSLTELTKACAKVDDLVYKLAIWAPGWKEDTAHIATWKRIRLPREYWGPYDILEANTFWVDEKGE